MTYVVTPVFGGISYEDVRVNGKTTRVPGEQTDDYLLARLCPGDTVRYCYADRESTFTYEQFKLMMEEAYKAAGRPWPAALIAKRMKV